MVQEGLEKILMSVKDLDDCETCIGKDFNPTCWYPAGWPGPEDQQNKTCFSIWIWYCVILLPLGAMKFLLYLSLMHFL